MSQQAQHSESGEAAVSDSARDEGTDGAVRRASVIDSEGYASSYRGVEIHAIRIGASREPNSVSTVSGEAVTVTGVHIGFPIAVTAQIPEHSLVLARIRAAAPGSRFLGIPLRAGQALLYGPATEHAGVGLPGTAYTIVAVGIDALQQRADQLRSATIQVAPGTLCDVAARKEFEVVTQASVAVADLRDGTVPPRTLMDDLLSDLAVALGREDREPRSTRRQDRGKIVSRCLELAESVDHRPSIREFCLAADVPERTLREAFVTVFDTPPSVYFRQLALNRAFLRLSSGSWIPGGVSEVALAAGFGHLGRFAHYYKQVFGESPSETYHHYVPLRPRLHVLDARARRPRPARV